METGRLKRRSRSPVSTTKSPERDDEEMGISGGEVCMVEPAETGGASSSGLESGATPKYRARSQEKGNKARPSTREKLDMSWDEVAAQEEEEEDLVEVDAQRDVRSNADPAETRTLYLHGIETLTEEELWRGLRIKVHGEWVFAFDLDAIEAQSYTRNPADLRGTGTACNEECMRGNVE